MSGSAVDYRKRPPAVARARGGNGPGGAGLPTTWSDQLRAAESDLSTARRQLERTADSDSDGAVRQVASYAANAANAAQAVGVLIRNLQERLDRAENTSRPAA